ncbi:AzlD domain-containing protein [Alteromonas lipolytica]|uniref:Branched-chain amino acid ABC transporter n=1 Tax=Alteromonas lipolytica TaxID=1856405 RepID=A0A1E8FIM9_9ALTE|nr:AzlD domain-containing protein [Alteromonas lipolytica]OFI35744.1 hypothetical protein BFC17_10685 [Alteromonas lipolytica]GGF80415.1 hypothetical protein GCM10011338_35840 [Alteromonas lipolytica]
MEANSWIVILLCSVGTFAIRALPLIWTRRHLARQNNNEDKTLPTWLGLLGPLMIAAMFGVSLVPVRHDWIGAVATLAGCITTFVAWYRSRTLGKPVFLGVVVFGLVTFACTQF